LYKRRNLILLFFLLAAISNPDVYGQTGYNYFYRVTFTDKGTYTPGDFMPGELLSQRSIDRRMKNGITILSYSDLPVYGAYIESIKETGLVLHTRSKWMNSAVFKSATPFDTDFLNTLPFVQEVRMVKSPPSKNYTFIKKDLSTTKADEILFNHHLTMLRGDHLHSSGFTGKGVLIAVLDAGFPGVDQISSLAKLRLRKGIKSTYDFINRKAFVYDSDRHGTIILTVLAGILENAVEGTAYDADFLLLKTEDAYSEYPVEEDYWVAAAEYADSSGADIITSSLGYSQFDNPAMDYTYAEMNGSEAFITLAADVAATKGIAVFSSAGNERDNEWKYISAPADGKNVIAIGAVDSNNRISVFSSAGPSSDGRIKPDICAMGVAVPAQNQYSVVEKYNGTSLSCPVVSGLASCLMQAVPMALSADVTDALISSADKYLTPDTLFGYGIPDMVKALQILQDKYYPEAEAKSTAAPNPVSGNFRITLKEDAQFLAIKIYDLSGSLVYLQEFNPFAGRSLEISALADSPSGLYIVHLQTENDTFVHKLINVAR